jgi:peptide-methionine (S)-S-oxide reductase
MLTKLNSRNILLPLVLAISAVTGCNAATEAATKPPAPALDAKLTATSDKQTAIFAGGCFWGQQAVFSRVKGVIATTAGYDGGAASTATYDQVTTETTNHAESVKVVFDPSKITYGTLLRIFFSIHDPTTLNRQGPDSGTSYRSAIFYTTDEQRNIASAYIKQLDAAKFFHNKIVTEVVTNKGFYDAESYHQDYALHNPDNPYIMVCDRPKIETLHKLYPDLYKEYRGK